MRVKAALLAGICASVVALPAHAQDTTPESTTTGTPAQTASPGATGNEIVVTAQRRAESLQSVPIAVSAFSAEALEKQQIKNASDLQLTLPNVTFTKGNFTGSSFTIRGIGDLCVGTSCDAATAIHLNGTPLLGTRLFETEYFDMERIEVLRGPQGTLFGRNATSGVVNFITAKPDLSGFHAAGEGEYGNYNSIKAKGMVNLPLGDTMAVRFAGFYLNRDGYTKNLYNNTRIDDRNMYSIRGSFRWEPDPDTTVDLMGSYFHERDNRMRIQKQLCQRDPTGVLGCLNEFRGNERTNSNSTLGVTLASREFLPLVIGVPALTPVAQALAITSIYGPDSYIGSPNSNDPREVYTAYTPTYFTDEIQAQARIDHNFGNIKAQLTGFWHKTQVDSTEDYNLGIQNRAIIQPTLNNLAYYAANGIPGLPGSNAYFAPLAKALIPNGPAGEICTSAQNPNNLGAFGGDAICGAVPLSFDRSNVKSKDYSGELIISSDFDGMFNFLLGGIYVNAKATNSDYYVNSFGLDYTSGVLGFVQTYFGGAAPSYLGPSYYRNNTAEFDLKSYGIFGEAYVDFSDKLKLTLGLRYNNDDKTVISRTSLFNFLVPYTTTTNAFDVPASAGYDADPLTAGKQPYLVQTGSFSEVTGRAVLDYKITPNNLLYFSYSRGYKSGGFNPPPSVPGLNVPPTFAPELIDAFEIGSKNTFANGALTLNATAFYYKYNGLQLSRIVARTSINDNINADIYGLEAEAIVRPDPTITVNMGLSLLHTKVTSDTPFINQRDPSGGNPNTVIIKDPQAFNCVVLGPSPAAAQGFVSFVNSALNASVGMTSANGLRGPQSFGPNSGLGAATGAYSSCAALRAYAASPLVNPGGAITVPDGIEVSIKGNELPQAPVMKFNIGIQKRIAFGNGWALTPRGDVVYTGKSFGNIFNGNINRIQGYEVVNGQIQLDSPDDRFYARVFVQNLFDVAPVTGLYLTDASSGLYTNIFTLEPRRYGIAAGFKF